MPYHGRHWASFPSSSPDPLCVFQHRMALMHLVQETPKTEDLVKTPDITQQTQLLGSAGLRRFLCSLLDHLVVSLIVSKRNSSILRGVQSQMCTSEEVTLHQPPPRGHGDINASDTVEQSCFAECKMTKQLGLRLYLLLVKLGLTQLFEEAASSRMLHSKRHFLPNPAKNGADHMFT